MAKTTLIIDTKGANIVPKQHQLKVLKVLIISENHTNYCQ
jgi:hypothetical protein